MAWLCTWRAPAGCLSHLSTSKIIYPRILILSQRQSLCLRLQTRWTSFQVAKMVNKWFIVIKLCTHLIHVYIEFSFLLWLLVCCKDPIKKLLLHQFLLVQYYRYLKIQISLILWPNQFQLSPSPCIVCILFKYVK